MSDSDESASKDSPGNRSLILYLLGILFGLLISGILYPGFILDSWDPAFFEANPLAIPPQIYLYAYIGTMAYGLIMAVTSGRPDAAEFSEILLRIPAALFLVTGVYFLSEFLNVGMLLGPTRGVEKVAFLAYATGLLIEQTIDAMQTLASRFYPGSPQELNSISHAPEWTEAYRR